MAKKNKTLVDRIAKRFDGNREVAQHALDSVVDAITKSLEAGDKVVIKGFGVFGRDRVKGKKRKRYVPTFDPAKELKDVVSGVKKARARVKESLTVLPAHAAAVAESATRAASSAARSAADGLRGDIKGDEEVTAGTARSAPASKKTATKKAAAKAAPAQTTAGTMKTPVAKKSPAKATAKKSTSAAKTTAAKSTATKKAATKKTTAP